MKSTSEHQKLPKTAQEIFDHTARHLLEQGKAAADETGYCNYRGPDGTMCAVGCHITDAEYKPNFEGRTVEYLKNCEWLPSRLDPFLDLLTAMQNAHDDKLAEHGFVKWKKAMLTIAKDFNLDPSALQQEPNQ